MSKKLELEGFSFDDSLDFDFEADIDGAMDQTSASKKKDRGVVSSVIDGSIEGAKDTLKSPAFYRESLRKALPSSYGEIADGVDELAQGSYKILDDTVKELKPRLGQVVSKLDKMVPENQKTLKSISERLKNLMGVTEERSYDTRDSQEEQLVASSLSAIFEQNKQYSQIGDKKQAVRDRVEGKMHDQSVSLLQSIDQNTKIESLYTTNVTQAYQKKSLELQLRTFTMQRDYYTKSTNYLEATKNQLEAVIKNTAMPEYLKITNSERFMEVSKRRMIDGLYDGSSAIGRGVKKLGEKVSGYVSGASFALDQFNYNLDSAQDAREQLNQMNEMLVEMGEKPLTKEQMIAAAATSAGLSKLRDMVTDKIRAKTEKMNPLKEKLARGVQMVLNPGAEMKAFQEGEAWQKAMGDYNGLKGRAARFIDPFMDIFSDDDPERTLREKSDLSSLNDPTMGFDNKAHITLVDIIPGHLASILREITMLRTGDKSTPMMTYDFRKREFVTSNTMNDRVRSSVNKESVGGMLNWQLDGATRNIAGNQEIDKGAENDIRVFITRLARTGNTRMDPDSIRMTPAYGALTDAGKQIVDLYLDGVDNAEDKQQRIAQLTRDVRATRRAIPSASNTIKDYMDSGQVESLRRLGILREDEDGSIQIDEAKYAELQDNNVRLGFKSDINVKEAIKKMNPSELLKSVNEKLEGYRYDSGNNRFDGKLAYDGIKNTPLYSWSYKKGEGDPGVKTGPMAQDVRRNLGDEVAPDGKAIDLQSMNGALMASVQHLGSQIDELSGKSKAADGRASFLERIEHNTAELLRLNQQALEMANASMGSGQDGSMNRLYSRDGTYGGLAGTLIGSITDLAEKVGSDVFKAAGKAYDFTKEEYAKPLGKLIAQGYKDSKDPVAKGLKSLFAKGASFAETVLDFGKKTITETLPAGVASVKNFLSNTWKTVKDFFNETKDLYLPDGTEPVIRAVKLRMGAYRDGMTGKVIETMDELLACKGDIVDSVGNIVLTLEEKTEGLYDRHGAKVKTFAMNVVSGIVGGALWLKNKAAAGLSKLVESGSGGLQGMKDMFNNKLKGFDFDFGGGKYVKSSYEVLVDIREILLGRGKSVSERMASEIGPQPMLSAGSVSGPPAPGASIERSVQAATAAGSAVARLSGKTGLTAKLSSLRERVFGKKAETATEASPELTGPAPEMAGPMPQKKQSLMERFRSFINPPRDTVDQKAEGQSEEVATGEGKEPEVLASVPRRLSKKDVEAKKEAKEKSEAKGKKVGNKRVLSDKEKAVQDIDGILGGVGKKKFKAKVDSVEEESASSGPPSPALPPTPQASTEEQPVSAPEAASEKKGLFAKAKGFFQKAKGEATQVFDAGKEAYGTLKENTPSSAATQGGVGEQSAIKALLGKISQLTGKGASQEEPADRKGGVKEREAKIEQLQESRKKEAAQLDPSVMNAQAPDMMNGVNNGIAAAKVGAAVGMTGAGLFSRAMDKTKLGRAVKSKAKGLFSKTPLTTTDEVVEATSEKAYKLNSKGQVIPVYKPEPTPDISGPPAPSAEGKNDNSNIVTQRRSKGDKASHASDSPDFVGPRIPGKEPVLEDKQTKEEATYDVDGKKIKKPGLLSKIFGKSKKFNDGDGDGDRDGGIKDREEKLKKLEEQRKAKPDAKADPKREKDSMFGGLLSMVGTLISGIGTAVGLFTKGIGGVLGLLTSGFGSVFKLLGGFGGIGKGAGLVGKGIGLAAKGAWGVGKFLATRALPFAVTGAMKLGGAALGAVAGTLAVPLLVGGLAVGGAYAAYKTYKYFTRNKVNDFDRIRIMQYGFGQGEVQEEYHHKFLALENYLYDGRVKFGRAGQASLVERSVIQEDLLEMFDIDVADKEMVEKFNTWMNDRFRPFFLHHATTLYKVNPKIRFPEIEKDLKLSEKVKYLETAAYHSGPYNIEASPIKALETANTDPKPVASLIDNMLKSYVEEAKKKVKDEKDPLRLTTTTEKSTKETKDAEKVLEREKEKVPKEQSPGDMGRKAAEMAASTGEDGKMPDSPPSTGKEPINKLSQALKTAPGGVLDGSGGREFVKLGKGMTEDHLQGLHPGVLKLFLGMAEEYNKLTGKSIQMNEGLRSFQEQMALREKYGNRAAKPGTSLHEKGLAIDIPSQTAADLEKLGLMRKYGFTRPIGGEPWHLEPAGIQKNVKLARDDREQADLMVEASPLRGGGGYAMEAGAKKYGRNQSLALQLLNQEVDVSKMKEQPTSEQSMASVPDDSTKKQLEAVAKAAEQKPAEAQNASVSSQLPSPQEVDTRRENAVATPPAAEQPGMMKASFKDAPAQGTSTEGGGAEKPAPEQASNSSTPISGRGNEGIKKTIEDAAKKVGIDPKTLLTFAAVESDMNPNAKAGTSSAAGLFQFIKSTWKAVLAKFGKKHGLADNATPFDPNAASLMAAEYLKENARAVSSVKPNPNATDLYLTHFLGPGGARSFLKIPPNEKAATAMPNAANSNRNIFFERSGQAKTTAGVYETLSEKLKKKSDAYGIGLKPPAGLTSPPASNDSSFGAAPAAVAAPASAPTYGTTGTSLPPPTEPQAPRYGSIDRLDKPSVASNDSNVITVEKSSLPPITPAQPEPKPLDPIRTEGGGVFLDPMGGSRQAAEYRARASENTSPVTSSMDSTLKSSLEVQRESLGVLKSIMNSLSPEAFAKVLGGASTQKEPEKSNPLKEADRRNLGAYKRDQNSTIDLSRKVA